MPINSVTLDDFTNGIMAGLTLAGQPTFNMKDMSSRLVEAFHILDSQPTENCQLRFHLESSPTGESPRSSRIALERAIHRQVIKQEHKQATIQLSQQEAEFMLSKLPFTSEFWQQLAIKCR